MPQRKKFGLLKKATNQNIDKLPESPGVYSLNNNSGKTQYIGKAKRGRPDERIMEHKNKGKIPFEKVGFIPTPTNQDAIKLEKKLIKQRKPPYNKLGK